MARLPIPGQDAGSWGDILNDYLSQAHDGDGTLKDNSVTAAQLAPGAVDNTSIADDTITAAKLSATNTPSSGQVLSYNGTDLVWSNASPSDPTLGGDLTGTASNAQIAANAVGTTEIANLSVTAGKIANTTITDTQVSASAAIAQSKIANLTTDLAGKVAASTVTTKGDLLVATAANTITRLGAGANGRVLAADSTQTEGLAWTLAYAALTFMPTSGRYYYSYSQGIVTTSNILGNNTLRFHPQIIPPGGMTIDRVGVEVSVAGNAGAVIRLGVYTDTGNGLPSTLIADFGTIAADTTGVLELTTTQAIPAGIIWWATAVQSAATTQPTVRIGTGNASPIMLSPGTSVAANTTMFGYQQASVSGALPASVGSLTNSGVCARMFYRIA